MSAAAAKVLEAVLVPDTLQTEEMHTFKDNEGRNYSYMFNFEQEFEHSVVRMWMEDNWRPVCAWASGIYLLLIFGGQSLMTHRQPFQLRAPLTAWNILLSVFSIMGAARTLPEFIYTFSTQGFHHSLCVPSFIERDRVSGFWTWMFVLSKVPELGDTIFIVLRKQRLIFLHWYHHVTVLIYCWYSFSEYTAPARWFVVMNFVVHSLMYTYYAFRALRFRIPRCVAMVITSLQLVQMVVGCVVNYTAYTLKRRGVQCGVSNTNLQMSLLMYTSYFVLFARFFYNTYFKKNEKMKEAGRMTYFKEDTVVHSEKQCDKGCKSELALEEEKTQLTNKDGKKGIKDGKWKASDFSNNLFINEFSIKDSAIIHEKNKTSKEADITADMQENNSSKEKDIPADMKENNSLKEKDITADMKKINSPKEKDIAADMKKNNSLKEKYITADMKENNSSKEEDITADMTKNNRSKEKDITADMKEKISSKEKDITADVKENKTSKEKDIRAHIKEINQSQMKESIETYIPTENKEIICDESIGMLDDFDGCSKSKRLELKTIENFPEENPPEQTKTVSKAKEI